MDVVGRSYVFCYSASGARAIAAHIVEAVEQIAGRLPNPDGPGFGLGWDEDRLKRLEMLRRRPTVMHQSIGVTV